MNKDQKIQFEDWLTNNMYINKATADLIIKHVDHYFAPSTKPDSAQVNLEEAAKAYQDRNDVWLKMYANWTPEQFTGFVISVFKAGWQQSLSGKGDGKEAKYREALEEIAEGKGRYSPDPFTHAVNTINDMKSIATEALKQ